LPVVTAPPQLVELRRQSQVLADLGVPPVDDGRLSELAAHRPAGSFVRVVPGLPGDQLVARVRLGGKSGFTTMDPADLARFVPLPDLQVPATPYVIEDVDTGAATLGVRPDDALPLILAAGRTPLTLHEGLAVVLQHPEWLRERNCFELLGSRAGDKRVTGLWLSKGAPRLGWCWGGNPHTWLGMATAGRRRTTARLISGRSARSASGP
jgi:hypothetical protein